MSASVAADAFSQFGISPNLLSGLKAMGFTEPTEVQRQCFKNLLSKEGVRRRDVVALARTGTGKTAAFGVPLIEGLDLENTTTQALVLCPTRELCMQVAQSLTQMGRPGRVRVLSIYGGDSYRRQIEGLKRGAQVVVATPGRLMDLMDRDGVIDFSSVKTLVLDEADEMISVGFREALDQILSRFQDVLEQTWLFSATMSADVNRITKKYTTDPILIDVTKGTESKALIRQQAMVTYEEDRIEALVRYLHVNPEFYGLVFCQTKAEVAELEEALNAEGFKASALHGDKSQAEREAVFSAWKKGRVRIVVATDVAARGLDVTGLTHVVNMSLPRERESYVHRIGRTGRAGREGIALTFVWPKRLQLLKRFERELGVRFEMVQPPSTDQVLQAITQRALAEMLDSSVPVDAKLARVVRSQLKQHLAASSAIAAASVAGAGSKAAMDSDDGGAPAAEPQLIKMFEEAIARVIAGRFARGIRRGEVRSVRVDMGAPRADRGDRPGARGGRSGDRTDARGGRFGDRGGVRTGSSSERGGPRSDCSFGPGGRRDRPERGFQSARGTRSESGGRGSWSDRPAPGMQSDRGGDQPRPARTFGRPDRAFGSVERNFSGPDRAFSRGAGASRPRSFEGGVTGAGSEGGERSFSDRPARSQRPGRPTPGGRSPAGGGRPARTRRASSSDDGGAPSLRSLYR